MIEEFIDSVLIIDDKENEIKELRDILESKDIWVKYQNPKECTSKLKNRKIIFLDIYLSETSTELKGHISEIRKILKTIIGKNFGTYGIVVWTNNIQHIDTIKQKIHLDKGQYDLPLFICGLDKQKFLRDGYDNLPDDLEKELKNNFAANFFINWSILVNQGRDKALTDMFNLVPDYQKQNNNLEFLLFKLAQNYTGIHIDQIDEKYPLIKDAFKTFNDLLVAFINQSPDNADVKINNKDSFFITTSNEHAYYSRNQLTTNKKKLLIKKIRFDDNKWVVGDKLTEEEKTKDLQNSIDNEITKLYSNINKKLLIDQTDIKQTVIVPGNVYEIKTADSPFKHPESPDNAIPIIIELTPPCDFSNQNRLKPRVTSGYIQKYNRNNLPTKNKYYKELWPILLDDDEPKTIIFDFSLLGFVEEADLKDAARYKILFRAKDKLFADILQKMSSHTARLGLSIIR